ncbi:MAG: hypothetical protein ACRYHQ_19140 [Janthinobacterium lividum]
MSAMLTGADRDKLVRVLGLTASPHDGERATAARMAAEMLRARGLAWSDVITAALPAPQQPAATSAVWPASSAIFPWSDKIALVLRHSDVLSEWECSFFGDLRTRRRLSPKQVDVLLRVHARLVAQGAR